jgi:energy-coupling factor transporter ATP-binding protein EcfA2
VVLTGLDLSVVLTDDEDEVDENGNPKEKRPVDDGSLAMMRYPVTITREGVTTTTYSSVRELCVLACNGSFDRNAGVEYVRQTLISQASTHRQVERYFAAVYLILTGVHAVGLTEILLREDATGTTSTHLRMTHSLATLRENPSLFDETHFSHLTQRRGVIERECLALSRTLVVYNNSVGQGRAARAALLAGSDAIPEFVPMEPPTERVERDLDPHQELLQYLFSILAKKGMRRTQTAVYVPVKTPAGEDTRHYKYHMDIGEWLYSVVDETTSTVQYDALTKRQSTPGHMTSLLGRVSNALSPFMTKSRSLFSLNCGIVNANTGIVTPYGDHNTFSSAAAKPVNIDVDETMSTARYISSNLGADAVFSTKFHEIVTPYFDRVLRSQGYSDDDCDWVQALLGRMLHNVGSRDDWQIALYFLGIAGSGKSTLLRLLAECYESTDIGYLQSDGEQTFADQHLLESYIVLALDVDDHMAFSRTRFNSYVSGEEVTVNRKFATAITKKWSAPVAFASNAQPPWDDVGGNLARRFVIWAFEQAVRRSDPHLMSKCRGELPLLLLRIIRTYLHATDTYGSSSLWKKGILPMRVHIARQNYLAHSSPLAALMTSSDIELGALFVALSKDVLGALKRNTDTSGRKTGRIAISPVASNALLATYNVVCYGRSELKGNLASIVVGMKMQGVDDTDLREQYKDSLHDIQMKRANEFEEDRLADERDEARRAKAMASRIASGHKVFIPGVGETVDGKVVGSLGRPVSTTDLSKLTTALDDAAKAKKINLDFRNTILKQNADRVRVDAEKEVAAAAKTQQERDLLDRECQ